MKSLKRLIIRLLKVLGRRRTSGEGFLVSAYGGLGNFIMMTPMVIKLRQLHPSAAIYILAGNPFGTEHVFRCGDGIVDDVFFLSTSASTIEKTLFFLKLRARRIQTAFIPFDAAPPHYWWGILLAGIPRRIGHTVDVLNLDTGWTREVLTEEVPLRLNAHETDLHHDLLEKLDGPFERGYGTHISSMEADVLVRFGLRKLGYITIQISAANAGVTPKRWTEEGFAELIRRFNSEGETPVLPGDRNEKPVIDAFLKRHKLSAANLAGMTSIDEVSTILKFARLAICNDSGQMHIANAHGTPLIALYGPTDDVFTAPKAPTSRVIRAPLPCAPCMKNFAKTEAEALRDCPINVQCMRDISVEQVHRAAREILAGSPGSSTDELIQS